MAFSIPAKPANITDFLNQCLKEGLFRIGQLALDADFSLCHVDDVKKDGLKIFYDPFDALSIARHDDEGKYRPLKTAPNLRHGWLLKLKTVSEVHEALDHLYPAALSLWMASVRRTLIVTPLRETLARQTGMYRVVAKITDSEAAEISHSLCQKGCLRKVLWGIESKSLLPLNVYDSLPLLCREACNLYVAEGRKIVKARAA